MPGYQRHVFVCVNDRPADDPRGCCLAKGSQQVRDQLKKGLKTRGLNRIVRANASGCLDACAFGATVVIYPEGVWYGGVTVADVEEIIERHIIRGEVIERLLMQPDTQAARVLPPLDVSQTKQTAPRS